MQALVPISSPTQPVNILTYNDKVIDHSVPDDACVLAQNCFLDNNMVEERTGYSMIANDTGENKPNLGFAAVEVPSGKVLLKVNDDATSANAYLYYWTGTGNWVKVNSPKFTAGVVCDIVVATGVAYIANGVDTTKKFDVSTHTLTDVAAIPITPYLEWFHNFLFALKGSRVYISSLSAPEVFPVGSYIDINPDDGDTITGAATLKDELVISKNTRQYSFQGWTETSFSVTQLNQKLASYGATSNDTYANIGLDLLFLSFGGGIPHIRSLKTTEQSATIYGGIITNDQEGTMKGLSLGQLSKAAAVFDGRKVWFFLPNGSSTYNDLTLVFDTLTKGVTKHVGIYAARAVVSTISGTQKIYFADSRNSKVYLFDGSYSDNGADIEMIFTTKRYQPDFTRFFKWKYLYMQYVRDSTGQLQVYTSVDDNPDELVDTLDLTAPQNVFPFNFPFQFSGSNQGSNRTDLPYNVNHNIRLTLYKKDKTAPAHVHDFSFYAKPKPLRKEIPYPAS